MITRCVYCGQYYSYEYGKEDPGYCGKEECLKQKTAESSFYAADVRIPAVFPAAKGAISTTLPDEKFEKPVKGGKKSAKAKKSE